MIEASKSDLLRPPGSSEENNAPVNVDAILQSILGRGAERFGMVAAVLRGERIESRRREYEKNLKLNPPRVVNGRFDPNAPAWPAANADAKLLEGIPVSPGIVTGPARVILRMDDHEQVLPGEILIAPFTDPAWSPYFITAAGLVVEQGGILSHGSIVAREYGLPAVTNVALATRVIRTGDLVQVDGNHGRVSVLQRLA